MIPRILPNTKSTVRVASFASQNCVEILNRMRQAVDDHKAEPIHSTPPERAAANAGRLSKGS
jgi:hypothetical protein